MPAAIESPFLRLHGHDHVAIAKQTVPEGTTFLLEPGGKTITTAETIEFGHKVALVPIATGEPIRKFGQLIGFASQDIAPGQWVHTHNLGIGALNLDYAYSEDVPPDPEPIEGRTFPGYRRADGRAATRNYVALICTVGCSSTTATFAARRIEESLPADYPNIDGIIAVTHQHGCSLQYGGEDHLQLSRVLAGYAKHPNIGACVVLGLGCETGQGSFLVEQHGLVQLDVGGGSREPLPILLNIQDCGGVAKTVDRTVEVVRQMLPAVNDVVRVEIPVSELILATECGGSDGNSGVTANPAVGVASDLLVAHGGTTILGETTEIYGAEHTLTRRARTPEVGRKLVERIKWWEKYAAMFGAEINNNPSIGNKKGGLTTIYEKSLGAIAKGGSTALCEVYRYAEPVTQKGLVIMDTPGYDSASVTGMVAGGAHVVVFTTGRGSCFGSGPVPTIKVASNTPMYERMRDDMDFNAGRILTGDPVEDVGRELFELLVAVAGGEQTKSERQGIGNLEFCPWSIGPTL